MSATPEEEDGPLDPQRGRATLSFGKWNREIQSLRPLRGHLPLHKGGFTGAVSPGSVGCRGAFQLPAGKSASGPRRFFSGTARRHHLFLKKRWWGRPSPTRSVGSPSRAVRGILRPPQGSPSSRAVRGMYSAWKRFFKKCALWAQRKGGPRRARKSSAARGRKSFVPRRGVFRPAPCAECTARGSAFLRSAPSGRKDWLGRAWRGNHLRPGAATHVPRFCADEKALFFPLSPLRRG